MEHTAAEVAALSHVPVATLGLYDQVGLVSPHRRTAAGEPVYGDAELDRLFLVQAYRELGLDVHDIARLLRERPTTAAHLRTQRRLLSTQRRRVESLLGAVTTALEYEETGPAMTAEEKLRMLGEWRRQQTEREMSLPPQRSSGTLAVDMKN